MTPQASQAIPFSFRTINAESEGCGGLSRSREERRDQYVTTIHGFAPSKPRIDVVLRDLKQSFRIFAQSPAFSLAAVAALTLGIGANTAIFSVVNAVLLQPVGVPDPDRVVVFMNVSPGGVGAAASPAKFQHYREQDEVVQDVAAFNTGVMNFTGGGFPEQLRSGRVSADFFKLTAPPVLLMAYSVEQRTQEIGIRLALGAQVSQVRRMVVAQGMVLAIAGVAIGLAAAIGLARLITSFLFGVTARDPLVLEAVPTLLAGVALLAVWIPARRASRVDPLVALRYEQGAGGGPVKLVNW